MNTLTSFYERIHSERPDYAGSEYDVAVLVSSRSIRRWLKSKARAAILDVGCGKGVFLKQLASELERRGIQVSRCVGLDLVRSPGNIFETASGVYEFVAANVDGHDLPFEQGTFDVVACNHVLEHVFETEKLLRNLSRVVSPDGIVIISVPNMAAWINRFLFLAGSQPLGSEIGTESCTYGFWPTAGQSRLRRFQPAGHIRDFTPRGLQDLCLACGLTVAGWWNQSQMPFFPLSRWGGRNMGVIAQKVQK